MNAAFLVVITVVCQDGSFSVPGRGLDPNDTTSAIPKTHKAYAAAKAAKNLSFDPKIKVRLWLTHVPPHNPEQALTFITAEGRMTENKIIDYGKPISLEGCYWTGVPNWNANQELSEIRTKQIDDGPSDFDPNDPRESWKPVPVSGVALRVRFQHMLDGKRFLGGSVGGVHANLRGASPAADVTFLLDDSGKVFGWVNSDNFATYDIRQDYRELGPHLMRTNTYDYRAPLK